MRWFDKLTMSGLGQCKVNTNQQYPLMVSLSNHPHSALVLYSRTTITHYRSPATTSRLFLVAQASASCNSANSRPGVGWCAVTTASTTR